MTSKTFSSIEDLVFDRSFRNWVFHPGGEEGEYWEAVIRENPSKSVLINQAKAIIYALQLSENQLTEEEVAKEISRILARIKNEDLDESLLTGQTGSVSIFRSTWIKVAAMLVVVAGSFYLLFNHHSVGPVDSYKAFTAYQKQNQVEQVNNTNAIQKIQLPDGSTISLEPNSKISYTANISGDKRAVYLVGEAFFEVAKDPAHPFYVYSNDIVTKVLGTSFRIKAPEGTKVSAVIVRTGKVSVFKKKNLTNADAKPGELGGTVLLPNQQVTYNNEVGTLIKSLVAAPVPLVSETKNAFVFNATPLKEVFQYLEMVYGIRIIADDEAIRNCSLSATMSNNSFYQKLDLICKSINASYEVVDGDIVITTLGCK